MLKLKSISFGQMRIFLGHGCDTRKIRVLHLELERALGPNVRAKGAPTVGRAGPVGENVPRTADRARVARRWCSL